MYFVSNISLFSSVFDVDACYIVNDNFNDFNSFFIFSNNSVHVDVHVNVDNFLNRKIFNRNFQSKLESNCNNFKQWILFSCFNVLSHF